LNIDTSEEQKFEIASKKVEDYKSSEGIDIKKKDLHLKFPAVITFPEQEEMAITPTEFLKLASSLIPEFDGKAENLNSFLDSLNLLNSLKESHEALAVNLIKTKLKDHARNLVDNENLISEIIDILQNKVKGESVDVISA